MLYLIARIDSTQANIVNNKPVEIPFIAPSILALGENQLPRFCEVPESLEIIPGTTVGTFIDKCCILFRLCEVGYVEQRDFDSNSTLSLVYMLSDTKNEGNSVNFNWVQVGAKPWDL